MNTRTPIGAPFIADPAADEPLAPHPLIGAPGTCGATKTGPTGIEWICVAAVHATEADIRAGRRRIDRHYYVNRHPWRTAATP